MVREQEGPAARAAAQAHAAPHLLLPEGAALLQEDRQQQGDVPLQALPQDVAGRPHRVGQGRPEEVRGVAAGPAGGAHDPGGHRGADAAVGQRDQAGAAGAAAGAQGREDPAVLAGAAELGGQAAAGPAGPAPGRPRPQQGQVDELRRVQRLPLHLGVDVRVRGGGPVLRVLGERG